MTIDQESNDSYKLIYSTDYTESLKKSHQMYHNSILSY